MASGEYQVEAELNIVFRACVSIFLFTILMLAVSSSFHKKNLKDIFINNERYITIATVLKVLAFSLVFSIGWLTERMISFPQVVSLYEISVLKGDLLDIDKKWIFHAVYFAITLFFLLTFASI